MARRGGPQVKIRIKLYGVFRIDRFKEEIRDYPPGTTVRGVAEALRLPGQLLVITSYSIHYTKLYELEFFGQVNETLVNVLTDSDTQWLFIVCGLMGSIIALIERGGGAAAFGAWVSRRAKTRRSTLLWTWFLGVVIFIDDYLNSLTVGSCMAPISYNFV